MQVDARTRNAQAKGPGSMEEVYWRFRAAYYHCFQDLRVIQTNSKQTSRQTTRHPIPEEVLFTVAELRTSSLRESQSFASVF
jgi:hypothetical protein